MRFAVPHYSRFLALLAATLFFYSAAVARPAHLLQHALAHTAAAPGEEESEFPHCDFCLNFDALDTASLAPAPDFRLFETSFAVVAALASFEYPHPIFFALGRGPPVLRA